MKIQDLKTKFTEIFGEGDELLYLHFAPGGSISSETTRITMAGTYSLRP